MTKREFLDIVFALAPTEANRIMDAFDEYVESTEPSQVARDIATIIENEKDMRVIAAQPEIIRCRECKFASGDSRICMKFDHSPIGELDFCSFAERREVNNESN